MIERHLQYFVAVAEESHFQRAAERLGITQSALSRRIQILEAELGVPLFERLPRGVRLTQAGEIFYQDVRIIERQLDQAKLRAQRVNRGTLGRLNIAINPSGVSNPIVIDTVRIFRSRYPDVETKIDFMYSEAQIPALRNGSLDLGMMYQFTQEPGLNYASVDRDRLVLALPQSSPLAGKERLRLADLNGMPFIWPARAHSPHLFDHMIATCNSGKLSPKIIMEVHSMESVLSIVAIGLAAGFVTTNQIAQVPPSVAIREIEDFTLQLALSVAWRPEYASPVLDNFLSALAQAQGK
jgi:DNA-binding transcriptional LysR family regulator